MMTLRAPGQSTVGAKRDRDSSPLPGSSNAEEDTDLARAIAASLENQGGEVF